MKSRPLVHLLLALLLLISQQIGFAHLISHGLTGQSNPTLREAKKNSAPTQVSKSLFDQACSECLFLSHLGLALPGSLPVHAHGLPATVAALAMLSDMPALRSPSPYLSRAPPF